MAACAKIFTFVLISALAVAFVTADQDALTHAVAQPDVGLDMVVDDNNDGIPDNSATAVGIVQSCLEARPGETVAIDVFVEGIAAGTDVGGFSYVMGLASTLSLT